MNEDRHFQAKLCAYERQQGRLAYIQDQIENADLRRARWLRALEWLAFNADLDDVAEQIAEHVSSEVNDQISLDGASDEEIEYACHDALREIDEDGPQSLYGALYTLAAEWPSAAPYCKSAQNESNKITAALAQAAGKAKK